MLENVGNFMGFIFDIGNFRGYSLRTQISINGTQTLLVLIKTYDVIVS